MATGAGYTYRDIDEMTLPEIWELFRHWRELPPQVEILYARYEIVPHTPSLTPQSTPKPTTTEEKLLSGAAVRSFDRLPLALQAKLAEMRSKRA